MTKYHIDYTNGWAYVTDGYRLDDPTKETTTRVLRSGLRRRIVADGRNGKEILIFDESKSLENWIRRATRKPFTRPEGTFVFRIIDLTGNNAIGRTELNEWPVK